MDKPKPKTHEKDLCAFERERHDLEDLLFTGKIKSDEYERRNDELMKKYGERVFPEDTHYFDTFAEYEAFFTQFNLKDGVNGALSHEKSHAQKALELGYSVRYGCTLFIPKNPVSIQGSIVTVAETRARPFVNVFGEGMTSEGLREILMAPEDPSDRDNDMYHKLEE
jgi:hypothetical protein